MRWNPAIFLRRGVWASLIALVVVVLVQRGILSPAEAAAIQALLTALGLDVDGLQTSTKLKIKVEKSLKDEGFLPTARKKVMERAFGGGR